MQDKSNIYPELKILSPLEQTWASYSRNPLAMAGLWCFLLLLLITLIGPLVVPYGIDEQHTEHLLLAPSWAATGNIDYFLGTDDLGRDMLSRLVVGARLTFGYALVVVVIAMVVGSAIGILGGMSKGLKSSVLHHLLDTLLSIPSLLMAIIMVAILGPGLGNTLIAITLALIPPFIRATYNAVHTEMQKEYITASRLDGSPPFRIMRLAILPNIVETLVAQTTRTLSAAILDISAVGFLGLGAQSPQPEWGAMLADSSDLIYLAPWTVTLPGIAILFSVLVTNVVGEGIREALKEGND
ncbi:ABC transporter permease subunit [Aeromonas sobria]|uniref:ABC transporter permease subunit n=1 Tax=Aeromonas sobria TaxID=646 RepID=UPI0026EA23F2|nr:ABC transporter permease subunit [Aeromonas sobria]HEH9425590.1 ABC transporter permease subunit [Aeromonas sobria]HEH9429180.1 ABC transporter permease subunit [Aeromonas sobria]